VPPSLPPSPNAASRTDGSRSRTLHIRHGLEVHDLADDIAARVIISSRPKFSPQKPAAREVIAVRNLGQDAERQ